MLAYVKQVMVETMLMLGCL